MTEGSPIQWVTTWPVPIPADPDAQGIENLLRYKPLDQISRKDLLAAASVVSAYQHMIFGLTQKQRNRVCKDIQTAATTQSGEDGA